MFDTKIYQQRREQLKKQFNTGILLFLGNEESPMNYADNTYPFHQDSTFLYYFGLDFPALASVLDMDEDREIMFGDDYTVDDIVWMGPQEKLAEKSARVGVREFRPLLDLATILQAAVGKGQSIHFLPQYRAENKIKLSELLGIQPSFVDKYASEKLVKAVIAQRSIKAPEEVEEIEAALAITYETHTLAMRMVKPGIVEREIAGAMEGKAYAMGGRLSFPTIFSIHGETLHNHVHGNIMKEGNIVVNDSGAESAMRYAGDITRTIPVSGKFNQKQREIYEIVLNAQLSAIDAIEPGTRYLDVHLLAAKSMATGLLRLGIMKGDVDEAVAQGAHALFFPHGLGHMMGLDVHDMENLGENYVGYNNQTMRSDQFGLRSLRLGKALQTGFVLTVEPGLYFIPELIDQWKSAKMFEQYIDYNIVEKYRGFGGIRIEDDVLVTNDGHRVLGKAIPKKVEDVEALASS